MMTTHEPEDLHLWMRLIREVRPLRAELRGPVRVRSAVVPVATTPHPNPPPQGGREVHAPPPLEGGGREGGWSPAFQVVQPATPLSLDAESVRLLAQGRRRIERRLDLHGLSQDAAHAALQAALAQMARRGQKTLLVITGKGGGVLREAVPRWLSGATGLGPYVHAIAPAASCHGGEGAFYVQLRRRK